MLSQIHVAASTRRVTSVAVESRLWSWRALPVFAAFMAIGAGAATLVLQSGADGGSQRHGSASKGWAPWMQRPTALAYGANGAGDQADAVQGAAPPSSRQIYLDFLQATKKRDPVEGVIAAVQSDGEFRRELLKEYLSGQDAPNNLRMRFILAESLHDEVMSQALEHMAKGPAEERLRAIALLASMQDGKPGVRDQLLKAMGNESDPAVLAGLISSVGPRPLADPVENAEMVRRLTSLRQHPDAAVRNAALGALAAWDGGQAIEGDVVASLQTGDASIVNVAMQAAMRGGLRSDGFKAALLTATGRADLPSEVRRALIEVLERFRLSPTEYDQVVQMHKAFGLPL